MSDVIAPSVAAASATRRPHPYLQIARTYLPPLKWAWVYLPVGLIPYVAMTYEIRHHPPAQIQLFLLLNATLFLSIVLHLKSQLVTPRAVVIPNYRRSHILIAAALALPLPPVLSLLMTFTSHVPFLPVLAYLALAAVLISWTMYLLTAVAMLIGLPLFFAMLVAPSHPAFMPIFTDAPVVASLAILAVCIAALIALAGRLMRLREEMPEYSRHLATSARQPWPANTTSAHYNSFFMRCWSAYLNRGLSRVLVHPTPWNNFRRWQFAALAPIAMLPLSGFLMSEFLFFAILINGSLDFGGHILILFAFAIVLPIVYGLGAWHSFAIESLRPLSRKSYLRARALTLALLLAQLYLAFLAIVILIAFFLERPALHEPEFWYTLLASLPSLYLVYALAIWFLRFRSLPFLVPYILLGFPIPTLLTLAPSLLAAHFAFRPSNVLAISLPAIVVVVTLILLDAHRRWLRTDFA